jgi:fibronectin type 3 domain-containing protein
MMKKFMGFLFGVLLVLAMVVPGFAFDVQLGWKHAESETVAEYRIYYGTEKGAGKTVYTVTDGPVLTGEVLGLTLGTTYYFHVTAVNQYGYESNPSNEVWTDGTGEPGQGEAPSGCFIEVLLSREEVQAVGE